MATNVALTEQQRTYLVALLKIGRGTLVAIDRALPDATRRERRELLADRTRVAADVARLEGLLIRG